MEDHKDLNLRPERPSIGTVRFIYQIEAEQKGSYQVGIKTLRWEYAKKENHWIYTGCDRAGDERADALVKWADVAAVIKE